MEKKSNNHLTLENTRDQEIAVNVDLDAYFQRIGYTGDHTPTLATLKTVHALHPQAIAFENLNPLLRLPVLLDNRSIQQKLVQGGRGGYCFEQNLLLRNVLEALGFKVKGLAARVLWNVPEGVLTPRGHMLLLVEINEQFYIADVGFGGLTLTTPLLLEPDIEQKTSHEPFRLVKEAQTFVLQAKVKETWNALYRFDLQEQFLPDYEVSSWYLSNHPNSHFITGLIAARTTPDRRYALRNNAFAVHHLHGSTERHTITSVQELRATLEEIFGLNLSEMPGLDTTLQRLIQTMSESIH